VVGAGIDSAVSAWVNALLSFALTSCNISRTRTSTDRLKLVQLGCNRASDKKFYFTENDSLLHLRQS
jgi:hypothetical protein